MTKGLEVGLNQIESLPIPEENSAPDPEFNLLTSAQISNPKTAKMVNFPEPDHLWFRERRNEKTG